MSNINDIKSTFNAVENSKVASLIDSYTIYGSYARHENLSETSDIDTVLVIKRKTSFSELLEVSKLVNDISKQLNTRIDNVIVTKDEVFNILSPHLLLNVYCDGIVVYGNNFIDYIGQHLLSMSKARLANGLLSTLSLKRHWMRKHVLNLQTKAFTSEDISSVCKYVIHHAREYTRFHVDTFIKGLDEAIKAFENSSIDSHVRDLPREFMELKQKKNIDMSREQYMDLCETAYNFVEYITELCEKKYLEISGEKDIVLKVF